jgi:hypothetical protein
MVNYQQGKIYKIIDNVNGNIYIGSTCKKTLAERLSQHKSRFKLYLEKSLEGKYGSFDIIKNGDYKIILIEEYPCNTKDQLTAREQYWIENTECVNKKRAFITSEQQINHNKNYKKIYYEHNKEQILEYQKQYREENNEQILDYQKQYREENNEKILGYQKKYRDNNKEQILDYQKQYREHNKERIREQKKQYYQRTKSKVQEQTEEVI